MLAAATPAHCLSHVPSLEAPFVVALQPGLGPCITAGPEHRVP